MTFKHLRKIYAVYLILFVILWKDQGAGFWDLWWETSRGYDFMYFYAAATKLAAGDVDLYHAISRDFILTLGTSFDTEIQLNHPPTLYTLMQPLAALPFFDAYPLFECLTYLAAFTGLYLLHRSLHYPWPHALALSGLAYAAMFFTSMNLDNLCLGQFGMVLLATYSLAFAAQQAQRPALAALCLVLAITAKAWPLTMLGYFVLPGLRGTLLWCFGWLAGLHLGEMLLHGPGPILDFLRHSEPQNWIAIPTSQSFYGYGRLYLKLEPDQLAWMHRLGLLFGAALAIGLWWRAHKRLGDEQVIPRLMFFGAFGLLGNLFAPHSCPHHLLWLWTLLPAYFALMREEEWVVPAVVSSLPLLIMFLLDGEVNRNYTLHLAFHRLGGGFWCRVAAFAACLSWGTYLSGRSVRNGGSPPERP